MNGKNIEVRGWNGGGWGVFILPENTLFFANVDKDECEMIALAWRKGYNTALWSVRDAVEDFKVI